MEAQTHRVTFSDPRPAFSARVDGLARQVGTFVLVGIVSTLAYAGLYALLRTGAPAAAANGVALAVTAVGNTAANRRLTFGVRGRASLVRNHLAGLSAFVIALAITSGAIALLAAVAPEAGRALELGVLIGANAVGTLLRFVLLRSWVARDRLIAPPPMRPQRSQP